MSFEIETKQQTATTYPKLQRLPKTWPKHLMINILHLRLRRHKKIQDSAIEINSNTHDNSKPHIQDYANGRTPELLFTS